ncbi:hypothetical protein [Nostoc sp. FACHB-133]|nr:hypothetical protein [Nostoc sp. FACHB-133]
MFLFSNMRSQCSFEKPAIQSKKMALLIRYMNLGVETRMFSLSPE